MDKRQSSKWLSVSGLYLRGKRQPSPVSVFNYSQVSHIQTQLGTLDKKTSNSKYLFFFFRFYLFLSRERGREGETEREKHQHVLASRVPSTGGLACKPGMCPDWELNQQPFGLQASAQSTELHQPGPTLNILIIVL